MGLENHMAEVARLVGEGAKAQGLHGVSGYARVALPIPESPDGTPYTLCIGAPHECTVPVSTAMAASAAAALVLEALKGPTPAAEEAPPPSTGELGASFVTNPGPAEEAHEPRADEPHKAHGGRKHK